jgi:hypothetical protein
MGFAIKKKRFAKKTRFIFGFGEQNWHVGTGDINTMAVQPKDQSN